MSINVNQLVSNGGSGTATTITASISNTQAGATLHVAVSRFKYDAPYPSAISSITDTQGNTYTQIGSDIDGDIIFAHYYAKNIVGGAGANTVTVTFADTTRYRGIYVKEIRDITGTPLDVNAGQTQASPGTGTDGVTTGSATNTVQPALVSAFALRQFYDTTVTAGTGFTSDGGEQFGASGGGGWGAESKRITATGSQAATFTVGNSGQTHSLMAVFAESSATTVTDVDTDETIRSDQTNVVVTGTGFGASQGAGSVTLRQGGVSVTQSIDSWADTSIQFDVSQGNVKYGAATIRVTNNSAVFGEIAVTLVPPTGESYLAIGTPFATSAERMTGTSDLASGDQMHVRANGGGAVPTGLTVNADGTFEFASGNNPTPFQARVWDATDSTWGSFGLQDMPDSTAPTAPGTPTITNITSSTATVTYTAATDGVGVTGYESSLDNVNWTDRGNNLSFTQVDLVPATAYTVRVRARDAAGNRGSSSSAGFTTVIVAPNPPELATRRSGSSLAFRSTLSMLKGTT